MKSVATSVAFVLGCVGSHSLAQSTDPSVTPPIPAVPAQNPCSGPEHRQLDFWVGQWVGTWTNANGSPGTGRNVITRDELGDCVITERFTVDDGSLRGFSISTYLAQAGEWRQTWMDDQGGYFDLFGGAVQGQPHLFALETYRRNQSAPYRRMIWENVTADAFTWRWQSKATADTDWSDTWVIDYTRVAPSGG